MEQTTENNPEYRKQLVAEYKAQLAPLLRFLPWLEQTAGGSVSSMYDGREGGEEVMAFPVYDGTLLSFVREAAGSPLMDRNYRYVYTRNRIRSHDDERRLIAGAGWRDWNLLRGILSRYVLGGRTKGDLWSEAVRERIFYLTLTQMQEIVRFWDKEQKGTII